MLFWVNKSGFLIDDKIWDRMWDYVVRIYLDGYDVIYKVCDKKDLFLVSKNYVNLYVFLGFKFKEYIICLLLIKFYFIVMM